MKVTAYAPGRVNLIGDHVDYAGGLVLPMAIDRGTTVVAERVGSRVVVSSDQETERAEIDLVEPVDAAAVRPAWARYVAGVVAVLQPRVGLVGAIRSDLPIGAGLSSSASIEVAVALALGFDGTTSELARACQSAEQLASGVPCGIMDQLASAAGVEGAALLIDCRSLEVTPVTLPDDVEVVVRHSGQVRALAGSAYAERRAQCAAAEAVIGPLRDAVPADLHAIHDPVVRRRARHVVTEIERVRLFAGALRAGDLELAGALMTLSHRSLRDDFEVSTPALEDAVGILVATSGVYGARLTGAGFGGCVVALADPSSLAQGWRLQPSAGASVTVYDP